MRAYRPSFIMDQGDDGDKKPKVDYYLRDPVAEEEIARRVALYADQFGKHGRITKRMPQKGSGKSASAMRAGRVAARADESERVLGDDE